MARSSKLRVMLSSRCESKFPLKSGKKLTDIRLELKSEIEKMNIADHATFEVWINEIAPPAGGTWDSWDTCIQAVKDCDILIILCNGDAGWAANGGDIGICHAEMMTGLSIAPAKVRVINIGNIPIEKNDAGERNKRFQDEIAKQSLFRGGSVTTVAELKVRVRDALHDTVVKLAQAGVTVAAKGKFHSGDALAWSRLGFSARRDKMISVVRDALLARPKAKDIDGRTILSFNDTDVLVETHAIPAAMTVGAAREMVGQPFLRDHEISAYLQNAVGGPLHIIACHKSATESQAAKLLGFPDATIVTAPFGVFVADSVQKVQFAFITNCRDEANTRHGVQRFFEWLNQTGEEAAVAGRALGRARIVRMVAEVQDESSGISSVSTDRRKSRSVSKRRKS